MVRHRKVANDPRRHLIQKLTDAERDTQLRENSGGGSLTALPIIETEAKKISAAEVRHDEAAERIRRLLKDNKLRIKIGSKSQKTVPACSADALNGTVSRSLQSV